MKSDGNRRENKVKLDSKSISKVNRAAFQMVSQWFTPVICKAIKLEIFKWASIEHVESEGFLNLLMEQSNGLVL
jgi:hypothetical protein